MPLNLKHVIKITEGLIYQFFGVVFLVLEQVSLVLHDVGGEAILLLLKIPIPITIPERMISN